MLIQLLCDNPNSWIIPFAQELKNMLAVNHKAELLHRADEVKNGDILVLLSCEKIFKALHLNKHNLVVHESDLPKGKGWSPLTWQVLEGKNSIPVTLFEASERIDSGEIYAQVILELDGTELIDELRKKQAAATQKLILDFVACYPNLNRKPQKGESTYYAKRTAGDSELNINKTISDQFNLLRICDNKRYPAFFLMHGKKYIISISKAED